MLFGSVIYFFVTALSYILCSYDSRNLHRIALCASGVYDERMDSNKFQLKLL